MKLAGRGGGSRYTPEPETRVTWTGDPDAGLAGADRMRGPLAAYPAYLERAR
ncbi:MAG: hypothetical protein J2P15_22270 [Micromonosporaceae bacterium]|nr:hypothetical protein [Micromonosporaceae bacterium]